MLRSYIISALRNLLRNKTQSLIQIFSLASGLMVFILGANDRFSFSGSKAITKLIPEVLAVSQFKTDNGKTSLAILDSNGIQSGQFALEYMMYVDSFFLDVFPQEFIWGNPLKHPGRIRWIL